MGGVMPRKQWKPNPDFLAWVEQYNQWRLQFHYPKLVASRGMEGLWFQALRSAKAHDESLPTWDELTAGAKEGPIGNGFTMNDPGWLLAPKGLDVYKNIQKMARWGRKTQSQPSTPRYSDRFR